MPLLPAPASDFASSPARTFVVRITEPAPDCGLSAHVEHVASGRTADCTSTQDLFAFFAEALGHGGSSGDGCAQAETQEADRVADRPNPPHAEPAHLMERHYRMVVEAASDAVITIDESGTILAVNPAVTRISGYSPAEIVGRPLTLLLPHESAARHLRAIGERVQTDARHAEPGIVEATVVRKNGEPFPVELSVAEILSDDRRTLRVFIRDVTERKQAEAIRAVHARQVAVRADVSAALARDGTLRDMLQGCAEAVVRHLDAAFARIWVVRDGRMLELHASAGMYTHLDGAHSRVPVGQLKIGLIAQEGLPHISNDLTADPRISDPDWARATGMVGFAGYPLMVNGRAVGVVAMFARQAVSQDTTDALATIADAIAQGIQRKQAEEVVRRSEAFLSAAQALSRTGSWGWNTTTGEVSWSSETYRIFGLEPHVAPTLSMIAGFIHPDDRETFEQDIDRFRRDRGSFEREYRLTLADGTPKHVHVVGRPVAGAFPDLDFVGSIMDVTERKQAEEALLTARATLEDVSRLTTVGELAASIAHEVNQPLATIVTNAQACLRLLRSDAPPWEDLRGAVSDIANAARRADDVITRIRLLLGKTTPRLTRLDLGEIIREVLVWTRNESNRNRIVVKADLAADLPAVHADHVQLQQVLVNLIRNAADAMMDVHDRPRTLTIRTRRSDDGRVNVAVIDAGTGIDPQLRTRIFDPFFTTKPGGMGMGLAICRSIVDAYGGEITATNNPGGGTIIELVLPAAGGGEGVSAPPAEVFVVDDDAAMCVALSRLLRSAGFRVQTFCTATELLDSNRMADAECLVLDVYLPDLSGLELQQRLAGLGMDLPIVFLTGRGDIPTTVRAMKAGALAFLQKPVDDAALLEAIDEGIARRQDARRQAEQVARLEQRYRSLTPRQREVFALVVRGLLNKQIAGELGTAERTVKIHRGEVMRKMDAASLPDLVRMSERLSASCPKVLSGPDPKVR